MGGEGMIVAINDHQLSVLWSVKPTVINLAFPLIRNVNAAAAAKQMFSVQPMTVPVGDVFYMDYMYGDSELDK